MSTDKKIVNLMPRAVNLHTKDAIIQLPMCVASPEMEMEHNDKYSIDGLGFEFMKHPVCVKIKNMPEPSEDTIYIVDADVLMHCKGRTDVFALAYGQPFDSVDNSGMPSVLVAAPAGE